MKQGDALSLPKGWEFKKLGDVCDIKTGKSNAKDADGKYTFFDRSKKAKKSNRFLFDCEALIIPGEGAQFFPRYYSGKFDLHQRVYSISNFPEGIDIHFIQYYLIFNHKHFERVAVGATVKSLRLRHFTEIEIPTPPLKEQKQIVAKLDQAFAVIDKAKENASKNLENSKQLFQSKLNEIFSQKGDNRVKRTFKELSSRIGDGLHGTSEYDEHGKYFFINGNNLNDGVIEIKENTKKVNKEELKKLGDVCEIQRGLTYSRKDAVDYSSNVVLRATDIDLKSNSLIFDELKYLRSNFEIKEKYELKKDSLLICFSSGSKKHLGKVALVNNHYKYAFGGFIGQITPNNNINPKYLFGS